MSKLIHNQATKIEALLSAKIEALHRTILRYEVGDITCHFLSSNELAVIIEDSMTPTEQVLWQHGYRHLARQVRESFVNLIQPQLKAIAEQATQSVILDYLCDVNMETGRSSIVIIFQSDGLQPDGSAI